MQAGRDDALVAREKRLQLKLHGACAEDACGNG